MSYSDPFVRCSTDNGHGRWEGIIILLLLPPPTSCYDSVTPVRGAHSTGRWRWRARSNAGSGAEGTSQGGQSAYLPPSHLSNAILELTHPLQYRFGFRVLPRQTNTMGKWGFFWGHTLPREKGVYKIRKYYLCRPYHPCCK